MLLAFGWDDLNPLNWVSGAVDSAVGAFFEVLVDAVMEGVNWLAQQIAAFFVDAGKPRFGPDMLSIQSGLLWLGLVAVIGSALAGIGIAVLRPSQVSLGEVLSELPVSVLLVVSCFSLMNLWLRFTQSVTGWILTDTVKESFAAGIQMDTGIVPWVRFMLGVLLVLFFLLFLLEQLIMGHLIGTIAALVPLGVGVRPLPSARYLSRSMFMMFLALSSTPIVMVLSLRIALSNYVAAGTFDLVRVMGALVGVAVTTLMPFMVFKLFPIGAGDDGGGFAMGAVMGGAAMAGQAKGLLGGGQRMAATAGQAVQLAGRTNSETGGERSGGTGSGNSGAQRAPGGPQQQAAARPSPEAGGDSPVPGRGAGREPRRVDPLIPASGGNSGAEQPVPASGEVQRNRATGGESE